MKSNFKLIKTIPTLDATGHIYKDKKRVRKSNRFIRANADGSEDIVELINPEHNLYAHEVKFRKIKTSRPQGEGELFNLIKK